MKAVSLWQPWASLIAAGIKRVETRHWATNYRGPIAIHAALRLERDVDPDLAARLLTAFGSGWWHTLPRGAVVATADLTDCRIMTPAMIDGQTRAELVYGDWTPGRYAWTLDNIQALPAPTPAKGRQGLWNWDPPPGVPPDG